MNPASRKLLTDSLAKLTAEIAADLRAQLLAPGPAQDRARQLHAEEKVGDDYAVWTDLLSRRAAVQWVLKSVYVRVFEDRGLLKPGRILDPESKQLFEHLAPNLGDTAYLRWVYRDLASPQGGLPELFSPQPAEVTLPSDSVSRKLIDFWRTRDPDTDELRFRFDDEHFDGRLMGDLYQDLDPVVKARYALLQTPDFVLDFILDQTLTPAIAEWGVETVRLLDPACGSGHFLIAAFKRLVAGMREKHPERPRRRLVEDCLARVVGIDLNDYACGLARARLVMTAVELAGETELAAGATLHPQVFWADGLEQIEKEEFGQLDLALGDRPSAKPRASLTRPEVRAALRPILKAGFHVVVGNPPYITEEDPRQREYHREKVGKKRRYVSASREYSLGAPFTERMFQLCVEEGFVGEITANSFMKREFGKALVEEVLPLEDLFKVVDTSGAHIPDHGTPTVLLFGRHRRPNLPELPVVMGKRGEPGTPTNPAQGRVWLSIAKGHGQLGFENEYVSVSAKSRSELAKHPWSIGGGGASELRQQLEAISSCRLSKVSTAIGCTAITGEDDAFVPGARSVALRLGISSTRVFITGEDIRNWGAASRLDALWPYRDNFDLSEPGELAKPLLVFLSRNKALLINRKKFSTPIIEAGLKWYEWRELYAEKLLVPLTISFAEVATHNHFALDRGGKVFKQTAPVIKLPPGATEDEHLALLGQLNSSTACFWLKQVSQNKAGSGIGRGIQPEAWMERFQFNGTKLESFPLASKRDAEIEQFARLLDQVANGCLADSPSKTIVDSAKSGAKKLREALNARRERDLASLFRMVALQEELDWLCYKLYGLASDLELRDPEKLVPLRPGLRPFEIALAREDAERRAALARGEEPDQAPTAWFERHGWQPATSLDELPADERRIVEARLALTESDRNLGLIEQPAYKRRWYHPDYAAEEQAALEEWLSDRIEDWAKTRQEPFTVARAVAALQSEPDVLAVAEVLTGKPTFDLEALFAERIQAEAVPNNKHHVFKPSGLVKRAAWESTWELQRREDAGEKVVPPVPPKYGSADFLRPEYWKQRGALDVPKERFIALTEVPGAEGREALFAWAGLTPLQRAKLLLALDEEAESDGRPLEERVGMLYGVWFQLPYVAWESEAAAAEFRAIIGDVVGSSGVSEAMLQSWAAAHPPPGKRAAGRKAKATAA